MMSSFKSSKRRPSSASNSASEASIACRLTLDFDTLRDVARFDDDGLWSQEGVWFSRFGTLLASAEAFVNCSQCGYFADELSRALHVDVQDAMHQLAQRQRVAREVVSSR
jgi:hypothetical protein